MHERVLRQAGLPVPPANADYPSLHAQPATRKTKRPLNVVIILRKAWAPSTARRWAAPT